MRGMERVRIGFGIDTVFVQAQTMTLREIAVSFSREMDEISREIGFSNRQSFYAAFYKYVGVTPREYRLAHNQSYAVIVSEREKKRAKKKE